MNSGENESYSSETEWGAQKEDDFFLMWIVNSMGGEGACVKLQDGQDASENNVATLREVNRGFKQITII